MFNRGPRIAITVEDDEGNAVAGATVTVALTTPTETLIADATTDSSGKVTFKLTGSDLDGDYTNAVTSITGTDISFVQCHVAADGSIDESTVTFTVSGTTATETGVVDECTPTG